MSMHIPQCPGKTSFWVYCSRQWLPIQLLPLLIVYWAIETYTVVDTPRLHQHPFLDPLRLSTIFRPSS